MLYDLDDQCLVCLLTPGDECQTDKQRNPGYHLPRIHGHPENTSCTVFLIWLWVSRPVYCDAYRYSSIRSLVFLLYISPSLFVCVCVFQGSESNYAEMKVGVHVAYLDMQLSQ